MSSKINTKHIEDKILFEMGNVFYNEMIQKISLKKSKMESISIIYELIQENLIQGKSNQEVYELYKSKAEEYRLKTVMNLIEFSKFVCKYFGFSVYSKKIMGKVKRTYQKIPHFADIQSNNNKDMNVILSKLQNNTSLYRSEFISIIQLLLKQLNKS